MVCTFNIDFDNLYPVTIYDTGSILKGTFIITSIFSTGLLFMFFGEDIRDEENIVKKGKWLVPLFSILCFLTIITTIGFFGDKLTSAFLQPFFMAIKKVNIFNSIENVESIFISVWMIADFSVLTYLVYIISYAMKNLIKSEKKNIYITPILFITYILSFMLSTNYFALAEFVSKVVMVISFALCFVSPIVTYIIIIIKEKIKNKNKIKEVN